MFYKILLVILFLNNGCSGDDKEEEDVLVSRCFVVKEKGTNILISGARVFLEGDFDCMYGGCGYAQFGYEETDGTGETCVTIKESQMKKVDHISCYKEGYKHFAIDNPPLHFNEILLEKY